VRYSQCIELRSLEKKAAEKRAWKREHPDFEVERKTYQEPIPRDNIRRRYDSYGNLTRIYDGAGHFLTVRREKAAVTTNSSETCLNRDSRRGSGRLCVNLH
jgi:hypothetical protein